MFLKWTPMKNNLDEINISSLFEITSYLAVACLLHMRPLINHWRGHTPVRSFSNWSARYRSTTGRSTTYISHKDKRISRRLPSEERRPGVEELNNSDVERDGDIHVLETITLNTSDSSTKAVPEIPETAIIHQNRYSPRN